MEIYLILKGAAMVIGATATLVTATAAAWPRSTGPVYRGLDRLSPVKPGALYRWLAKSPLSGHNGNGVGK